MKLTKQLITSKVIVVLLTALNSAPSVASSATASTQLKQAISNRKAGEFNKAIDLLVALRKDFLNHKRINIELALNYIKMREFERADQLVLHLQSLDLNDKEQKVVTKLKTILSRQMKKSLTTHVFSVSATSSAGVDIVENNFPVYVFDDTEQESEYWESDEFLDESWIESDFVYTESDLADEFSDREEDSKKTEVAYFSQSIESNYRYRPVAPVSWLSHPTQWLVDVDAQVKYKQFDKQKNNDYLSYYFDASLYMLQINRWLFELSAMARLDYADRQKLVNKTRLRAAVSIPFSSSKIKLAYDLQKRHYREELQDYNATLHVPWIEYAYTFSPSFRVLVGAKYHALDAQDSFNSYTNMQFYSSLYYFVGTQFIAYTSLNHYSLHYDIDDPEIVAWSKESKRSLALGLKYQFNNHINVGLAGNIGDNRIENGFGEDSWQRIEATFEYKF